MNQLVRYICIPVNWLNLLLTLAVNFELCRNFRDGEPNDAELPGEDCGEISSDTGKWNDETCVDLNGYVCERSLSKSNIVHLSWSYLKREMLLYREKKIIFVKPIFMDTE